MKSRLLFIAMACFAAVIVTSVVVAKIVTWSTIVRDEVNGQIVVVNRRIDRHEKVLVDLITAVPFRNLQSVTVRVDVGAGCGTGVLVTRQIGPATRTFVWTAGHVVRHLRNEDGTFRNAAIYQEERDRGKYKGKSQADAKVIAYSDPDVGEDLALLEILQDSFRPLSISAVFFLNNDIPAVGTELVHVGCTRGLYNSVSLGVVSQTDRDLYGRMYDQTSTMGYPGSSGGGVYLRDGTCIGLLTRGIGPGLNFIIPVRRMLPWAKRMKIEWAINPKCPVPTHVVRDATPLTDGTMSEPTPTLASPKPDQTITMIVDAILKLIRAITASGGNCSAVSS